MTASTCDLSYRRGPLGDSRWVCLTHDVEVLPRLVDAYISHPGPKDFWCPIAADTLEESA